jgi:CRAL/TRIO domain
MGQLIIVNAPTSFTAIWSMIKPWLAPRTLDKISILGANQPDQHATLLDLVAPENLPVALGGTCTCSCTDATDAAAADCKGDSDDDSDSDSCSSGGSGGGGGGCMLSNAGPWMDGRADRRVRWLRGEIPGPSVPWPPLQKQEEQEQGHAVEETRDDEKTEEEAGHIDAPVASAGAGAMAAAAPSPASCSRTSVVGLPLPLTHPPPPAAVRLVV